MTHPVTIRAIITGTTGMVGEGVLYECLQHPQVEAVLVINRKKSGMSHPKLTEIIHPDFLDISPIENYLVGYNACFFCLGVSSVGTTPDDYYTVTYTLTLHVASTLSRLNKDMTFCYVSGAGTDTTEKGRLRWARVKGKTENDLRSLPFLQCYAFRPGFIQPIKGLIHTNPLYKYVSWMFPLGRSVYPAGFCTLTELGLAMIHSVTRGYSTPIVNGKDIILLAKE